MSRVENISRRQFLEGGLSGAAFVLGIYLGPRTANASAPGALPWKMPPFIPMCFLGSKRKGRFTSLPTVLKWGVGAVPPAPRLADELDAEWDRVKIIQAVGDARYGSQDTDASRSILEFLIDARSRELPRGSC